MCQSKNRQYRYDSSGYVLFLVLVVLSVAGILFSVTFKGLFYTRIQEIAVRYSLQARLLAESGLARVEYFLNGGDGHDFSWETEGLEEKMDPYGSFLVECRQFGGYSRIKSIGTAAKRTYELSGFVGRNTPKKLSPIVTITGGLSNLIIEDGTTLNGIVCLQSGEVKRENRRSIRGSQKWTINRTSPPLPFDHEDCAEILKRYSKSLETSKAYPQAIRGNYTIASDSDSLLMQKPVVITGDCRIVAPSLKEKEIVVLGTLTFSPAASCSESALAGRRVIIEGGTVLKSVFFAKDSITIEGGIHSGQFLSYGPISIEKKAEYENCLWVSQRTKLDDTTFTGGIRFEQNGTYCGHAICFHDTSETFPNSGADILLGENSTFKGTIITNGALSMRDVTIEGHIWANRIITEKDDRSYVNFLFGCRLSKSNGKVPFPLLGEKPVEVIMF